ncbi:CRISPR-associated endonuclease Cas1 [Deferrisoma palaeochoriense]
MKSLYLVESDGLEFVGAEGGALRIEQKGRAPWYVPAARVERAVVWGSVRLDTEALGLLLRRNVPVSFVARGGETLGIAWSPAERLSRPAVLLAGRRADPDWREAYRRRLDAWVREARLDLVRRTDPATAERWCARGFRGREWEAWREARLGPLEPGVDPVWKYLRGLVWEMVTARVLAEGFDPHAGVLDPRQRYGFVREMTRPFVPWIDGCVLAGARAGLLPRPDEGPDGLTPALLRRWTARFEGHREWLEADLGRRLVEVARLARDWQPALDARRPPRDRRRGP